MSLANIFLKKSTSEKKPYQVDLSSTILSFKEQLAIENDCKPKEVNLVFKGKILKDNQTFTDANIQESAIIFVVISKKQTSPKPSQSETKSSSQTTNTQSDSLSSPPKNEGLSSSSSESKKTTTPLNNGLGSGLFNPFGLGGLGGMGGYDALSSMSYPGELEYLNKMIEENPDLIANMMNNPMVKSMINDPNRLKSMISSNPQMQKIFDENPELQSALDSDEMMEQMNEILSDPQKLKDLLKEKDRVMQMAENNADLAPQLDRLTSRVQGPMEDALVRMNQPHIDAFKNPNLDTTNASNNTENNDPLPDVWESTPSSNSRLPFLGFRRPMNPSTNNNTNNNTNSTPSSSSNTNPATGDYSSLLNSFRYFGTNTPAEANNANSAEPLTEAEMNLLVNAMMASQDQWRNKESFNTMREQMMNDPVFKEMCKEDPGLSSYMSSQQPEFILHQSPEMTRESINQAIHFLNQVNPREARSIFQPFSNLGINAETLNSMMEFYNNYLGQQSNSSSNRPLGNQGLSSLLPMLQGNHSNSSSSTPANPNEPPEVTYRTQLQQLHEMGFWDDEENIRILRECGGNVARAIDRLFS